MERNLYRWRLVVSSRMLGGVTRRDTVHGVDSLVSYLMSYRTRTRVGIQKITPLSSPTRATPINPDTIYYEVTLFGNSWQQFFSFHFFFSLAFV